MLVHRPIHVASASDLPSSLALTLAKDWDPGTGDAGVLILHDGVKLPNGWSLTTEWGPRFSYAQPWSKDWPRFWRTTGIRVATGSSGVEIGQGSVSYFPGPALGGQANSDVLVHPYTADRCAMGCYWDWFPGQAHQNERIRLMGTTVRDTWGWDLDADNQLDSGDWMAGESRVHGQVKIWPGGTTTLDPAFVGGDGMAIMLGAGSKVLGATVVGEHFFGLKVIPIGDFTGDNQVEVADVLTSSIMVQGRRLADDPGRGAAWIHHSVVDPSLGGRGRGYRKTSAWNSIHGVYPLDLEVTDCTIVVSQEAAQGCAIHAVDGTAVTVRGCRIRGPADRRVILTGGPRPGSINEDFGRSNLFETWEQAA